MKDHYVSLYKDIYATSIVDKYLYTSTVQTSTKFYKTTFPYNMVFTKADACTNDEQVEKFNRELDIYHRSCIIALVYLI